MSDSLIRRLGELPAAEPDVARAEHIRTRCHAHLARRKRRSLDSRMPAGARMAPVWQSSIAVLGLVYLIQVILEEIEVIDQAERFDGEDGRHVAVVDGDQVVAVLLLAAERQVRRSAVHDRVGRVEPADDELVVDLVAEAETPGTWSKGGGSWRVAGLAGDEHAGLPPGRCRGRCRPGCRRSRS